MVSATKYEKQFTHNLIKKRYYVNIDSSTLTGIEISAFCCSNNLTISKWFVIIA